VNPTVDDADLPEIGAAERLLASARAEPPGVGEYVGNYELVEEVGRGAQSVVYRARQQEPVRREVALKVLYDPADGGNMRARFFRERALLARVSHHGLAQLLDCGETAPTEARAALPWFAMPFIEGEPIDRWCMRHGATRAVKLVLLERVADAVGAAHAVGVIHRDIKPSNILVAGSPADPRVIVIDFGIAKVLEGDATPVGVSESGALRGSDAIATRHGAVVGTPEFMRRSKRRRGERCLRDRAHRVPVVWRQRSRLRINFLVGSEEHSGASFTRGKASGCLRSRSSTDIPHHERPRTSWGGPVDCCEVLRTRSFCPLRGCPRAC
jgi:serine/threonine protein kinase